MKPSWIVKTREVVGSFTVRTYRAYQRGIHYTRWRTVGRHRSLEEAKAAAEDLPKGLREVIVTYRGKRIWTRGE